MDYLEELNEEQRRAVTNTEGAALVIAGAGSGKTRVLTYRIAHLLDKGIKPYRILALTFTNKAAREMQHRISDIVGFQAAHSLWMGTFHSIFSRILRYESDSLGFTSNFTIYDSQDSKNLIKSIIKELRLNDKEYRPNTVLSRISMAKNNLITSDMYSSCSEILTLDRSMNMPRICDIYKRYSARCKKADAMDFDDLLLFTNTLFRDKPDILAKYRDKFQYILVDEYQDTNYSQYKIINKLAQIHKNICVVGDDAQSIYSFRGAKIENILNFKNDYPEFNLYKLERNYRSTPTIVKAANSVIHKNRGQIKKTSYSENEDGEKIKLIKTLTDKEEGFKVANEIYDRHLSAQINYKDFAILYRTNAQSRVFEEALRKRNIPYKIYGGLSFYQRKEIKDILAYFRLSINHNDDEALKRVINYPKRGIGATTMENIKTYADNNELPMWDIVANINNAPYNFNSRTVNKLNDFAILISSFESMVNEDNAYDAAIAVANRTGIVGELQNDNTPEGISRQENVQELLNGIKYFTENELKEGREAGLGKFMEQVALLTDQDSEKAEDIDKVTLMTVHSAKGLEFKHVFIVGLEEQLFPSNMSTQSDKSMEEERRLFYVALTRAEENVTLSYTCNRYKWGEIVHCRPSRFIKEIDPQFVNSAGAEDADGQAGDTSSYSNSNHTSGNNVKNRVARASVRGVGIGGRRLTPVQRASMTGRTGGFKGDDPDKLQAGMKVEHQKFGIGKVLSIENSSSDKKAIVFFQNEGQKHLLLKYAKLKIIND